MQEIIDHMSRTSEVIREATAEIGRLQERMRLAGEAIARLTSENTRLKLIAEGKLPKPKPVAEYDLGFRTVTKLLDLDRGGTGHGDESYSDADPGL